MSTPLIDAVLQYTDRQTGESPYTTPVPGLFILRSDHARPPTLRLFRPALCMVVQGEKLAGFGDTRWVYREGEALVVGIEAPSLGRVTQASPQKPCLVIALALDQAVLQSVAEALAVPAKAGADSGQGVFVTHFQGPLADCALRLVQLLQTPEAIPFVSPLVIREMYYWLLTGPHGRDIARIAQANPASQRILDATRSLRSRFSEAVRLEELATLAQLSPSAFHRQFKALTSLTPLQYQKQLRLMEARRLMVAEGVNVETASYRVGYESPSQFSREYSRLFGAPPKQHAMRIHRHAVAPV